MVCSKHTRMYDTIEMTQDQAITHLFFHCCMEDEAFTEAELDDVSGKFVELGLYPRINFGEEIVIYRTNRKTITDEDEYIRQLLQTIRPVNELALFSWCVELCLVEPFLDPREESLLKKIGKALDLDSGSRELIIKLMAQRKAVKLQKIF
jgi:hypothetical protein